MRCRYNFLKGYEFDSVKAASNFDEKPNSPGMDQLLTITVDTIPQERRISGLGSGHRLEGDGKRRFIFVLDGADDKESLEKKPLVIEELDPMIRQATELVLSGPFIYVSDD
ncbi:hypothetical protein PILCRDRAFT_810256 [Piloderma croceum F 1598]|uniref:Uncharacterized protein n=1 Tax=Piloderma croceum (strain F 1598) TaxID=765440 RepID=A0A0C3G7M2_PILCF|nr:hypothetical protein PILCRDRAFT_810256 [Piloderma croceum F 1598]